MHPEQGMGRRTLRALREEKALCWSASGDWPVVRAVHLRSQHATMPAVVVFNQFFALLTASVFRDVAGWPFMWAWVVLHALWGAQALQAWWLRQARPFQRARPNATARVLLGTGALSLLWSAAVLAWFGQADDLGRNFMVAVVVGAMCVGAMSLSALATAAWVFLLPLTLATTISLILYPRAYVAYELSALLLYTLALGWFALHITRLMTAQVLAERRLRSSLLELEQARTHLQDNEKLASLGTLVAGVSHEVNTPLGVAVTACSCAAEALVQLRQLQPPAGGADPAARALLEEAMEAVDMLQNNLGRAAKLVASFKQTVTSQVDERCREFDVVETVRALLVSLQPVLRRVPVSPRMGGVQHLLVRSSPGALIQVLTNLLINSSQHAFEGMAQPGIDIEIDEHPGGWRLRYRDNGIGVPPALQQRIFEPFFTTRRGRGGTGLGLSIVHSLVTQQLGGHLSVWSEEGAGLGFVMELPREAPAWQELVPMAQAATG